MLIYTREAAGQDTKGWQFIYTLGDRTPAGTSPSSIRPIAAAASYRKAPLTWCVIHAPAVPEAGWSTFRNNDMSIKGGNAVYKTALTSQALKATAGGPGGLNACPDNPFSITGQTCTDIAVSGEPALAQDGSYLQDTQVGDLIGIDNEYMRILTKSDSRHLTVQRGYLGAAAAHSGSTLTMACSARNKIPLNTAVWNYRADPYGQNANWSTIMVDNTEVGGHAGEGGGVRVDSVGTWYRVGESICPSAILSKWGSCYQIRRGTPAEVINQVGLGVAENPPFGGVLGVGNPNTVDSHEGPCQGQWCLDARPMDGGSDNAASMAGSTTSPWVNVSGSLWKLAGGANSFKVKIAPLMAYVGRSALVDVSGPESAIAADSTGAYQYCIALKAGECRTDSAAGDIYANTPVRQQAVLQLPWDRRTGR